MKTLVIAEKPSVGRDIARVLKCAQKGEGFLSGAEYVVTWAIGHLAALKEPEDYDPNYKKWRMDHLPIIPEIMVCKAITQTKTQLAVIKKLMNDKEITQLICATDSGREGELIFRYIYELAKCKKPFKRLWISSMTDAAVSEGFARLRDGHDYDGLYTSAKCRAEADWLVGMNATRAYTLQYGTLLSIGRVQTPTLAIMVNRQKEIDAFIPTDYWEAEAAFQTDKGAAYPGMWFDEKEPHNTKITDRGKAEGIAEKVKGQRGTVESVTATEKRQPPPNLFDLTELQRECNRRLGFSAQKTLSIAQSLYEKHKLITYPRTDSRYISHDMVPKLPAVIKALSAHEPYAKSAAYVLGLPKLPVSSRIADDAKITDHHAIIPTGHKIPASLTADEAAVFDRIVRKFLAVFFPAQVSILTTVITRVCGEPFITKGKVVTVPGWTVLYEKEKNNQEDDLQELPAIAQGEPVKITDINVLQKKTQPPKPYTEAALLSAMEHAGRFVEDEAIKEEMKESGLGTPATRAAIIERLLTVGYITRQRKNLIPTEKGIKLVDVIPEQLRSPETTGKWERGLSRIATGGMDSARFMESIRRYVRFLVESAASGDTRAKKELFPKETRETYAKGKRSYTKTAAGTSTGKRAARTSSTKTQQH